MLKPVITYSAKIHSFESYDDTSEIFAGTYTHASPIGIDVRIWNNRYGVFDVEDLKDFALNFYFKDFEDASLLNFLKVTYNNIEELNLDITGTRATAKFFDNIILSGKANSGEDKDRDNYIDLLIEFDVPDKNIKLKSSDMKSLFLEIVKL